jgi:hypothetical protein
VGKEHGELSLKRNSLTILLMPTHSHSFQVCN